MNYMRSDITDADIQALVDQQLAWEREKVVRSQLDTNPLAKARYLQLLQQKKQLHRWWQNMRSQQH